jgi:fibronectin type 3 domain-containing protein
MPYLLSRLPPSGRAAARRARQKRPRLRGADRGRLRRLAATSSDYLALPPLLTWRSGFGAVLYSASKSLDRKPLRLLLATCLLTLLAAAPASAAVAPRGTPTTTTDGTGTATSKSFTTPSAAVAGDLLVSTISYRTRTASDIANVVPSGWAKATEAFDSGGSAGVHVAVIYRTATGGAQTAAWSFASAPAGMVISTEAYSGADTSAPFERIGCGPETGPSSTYNHKAPTFTPTVGGTMGFAAFGARASETWTPSTPLIERTDARAGSRNQATLETNDTGATTLPAGTPVTFNSTDSVSTSTEVSCGGNVKAPAVADTTPPTAPSNLTATPGDSQVSLSWGASTDNVGVAGYRVVRNGTVVTTVNGSATTYTDTGLTNSASYSYVVRAFDGAGNTSADSNMATATPQAPTDTTPPDTSIIDHPANPTTSTRASFSFTSSESGSTFECALDGGAYGSCTSPKAYSGLTEGNHSFSVRATDAAGNTDPTPATYSWTIDTTAPDTSITDRPSDPTTSTDAAFAFTSSESGSTFQCALDGGAYSSCTSPKTYSGLNTGSHTFAVKATDGAENTDASPASYTWTINPPADSTPPETTITSHPSDPTTSTDASFGFSSTESGSTFQCSLDGAAYASCSSPKTYSGLTVGSHTFNVKATDAAGNTDLTPATFTWQIQAVSSGPPSLHGTPATTTDTSGTATSKSFSVPSASSAGDLLVASISYQTPTTTDIANTVPSGWTLAGQSFDVSTTTGAHSATVYRKQDGSVTSGSWSFGSAPKSMVISVAAYSNANVASPFDKFSCLNEPGGSSTTTHKTPAFTPSAANTIGYAAFAIRAGEKWTPVAPLVERSDVQAGTAASLETNDTPALTSGTSYQFSATEPAGTSVEVGCGGNIASAGGSSGDTAAPAAPTGLATTAGDAKVTLSWNASSESDLNHYVVYRNGTDVGHPASNAFTDTGLTNGTKYDYQVTAVDNAGNESAKSATASATPQGSTQPTAYDHIVWIVMENTSYEQIVGSSSAPYINSLVSQFGSATNFHAENHPSLPNYIAMTSGSEQGISDDGNPSSHPLNVENVFHQLPAGASRSLEESMPSNCFKSDSTDANGGKYSAHHNPMAYYTNLGTDCANFDVPLGSSPDLSANFTFITPNQCNNMHDCSISTGDSFLQGFVPKIMNSSQYQAGKTAIFITWDEDDTNHGNHIPTLIINPNGAHETSACQGTSYTHYSMLRYVEANFGLPPIGSAASANSMAGCFGLGSPP